MRRWALLLCLPLVVVGFRLFVEAGAELEQARFFAQRGDREGVEGRIAALGRAARRYLPVGPSATARRELAELGRRETPGAYEELRASILASRWLITPDRDLLDEAEAAIAQARARAQLTAGASSAPEPARVEALAAEERVLLRKRAEPSRPLAILALAGCALFLLGLRRALGQGEARARLVAGLGFALLVVGLWRA